MKPSIGFALGLVTGCLGLLLAQSLTKPGTSEPSKEPEPKRITSRPVDKQLADARKRISELEAEAAMSGSGTAEIVSSRDAETPPEKKEDETEKAASFLEIMMSLGDEEAKRKIEAEVERLAGVLNLTENQQSAVREALQKKAADEKAAGLKIITGKATIDDLVAADEHNFKAVDESITGVLDADQLAAFEDVQAEREVQRIETKTDEEIERLAGAAELTENQRDAAWEVLAEINAAEPPGELPEGTGPDEFMEIVDDALAKRVDSLAPILDDEQLQVYDNQVQGFRKMIGAMIQPTTGASSGDVTE